MTARPRVHTALAWQLFFPELKKNAIPPCRTERRAAGPPSFLEGHDVTAELRALRLNTLVVSAPALPLYSQGAHIVGRYRRKCLLQSLTSLTGAFLADRRDARPRLLFCFF